MFLIDTNIFLEILLRQEKSELCKQFIRTHQGGLYLSDFSLHSIGVIVFRVKKPELLTQFSVDMLPCLDLVSLPSGEYEKVATKSAALNLDFDDTYQLLTAQSFHLTLATLDKDFKRAIGIADIHLLSGDTP
jgi:predicted nucleic acid-binding protein